MSHRRILVVAALPDDEVLGPGGTIAAAAERGDHVIVYIAAEGVGTRNGQMDSDAVRCRSERAADILGVSNVIFGGYGYNGTLLTSDADQSIVREVEVLIDDIRPQIVLTHFPGDIHSDHRALARAVRYATRVPAQRGIGAIVYFETLSSTEQGPVTEPHIFADISGTLERKLAAMQEYAGELFEFPHPRSIEALVHQARFRGQQVGFAAAEAFFPGRITVGSTWTGEGDCV